MDAHKTRAHLNLTRCYIAALSDLVWSAAEIGDTTTLRYYHDKRHEAALGLKTTVICGQRDNLLSGDEAAHALSPISSLADAVVFTD
ncbi:hypothetical protein HUT18_03500 [Streptomyces sp. NA04227]|uniref:hypothetical protein n=1 Tax=Streptomyces sp. NA04227 TaxID=2742136 RepID=UPI001590BD73|nr:hypothetical protein [Streptomyces sp. NA04227]QKW05578.1 hypothetical protein HUT18_03500 [Streptomyces sp. NA04227]